MFRKSVACFTVPVAAILTLLFSSCANKNLSTYLNPSEPEIFEACAYQKIKDLQFHSYLAILYSLDNNKWFIKKIDSDKHELTAEGCYMSDQYCTEIIAKADANGMITIHRTSSDPMPYKQASLVERRWMPKLKASYKRFHCETTGSLLEKVKKFGIQDE